MDDWSSRFRIMTFALIGSGALNISLGTALYVSRTQGQQALAGPIKVAAAPAEALSCAQVIQQYRTLSYRELVALLTQKESVEEGYTRRDLALSTLVAFHEFDIDRALPASVVQRRILLLPDGHEVVLFPALSEEHYQAIVQFAYLEKWPLTFKGLWGCLKRIPRDPTLEEAFAATVPFAQLELLFQKSGAQVLRTDLIQLAAEAPPELLDQFARQQGQILDLSPQMRQHLLLGYLAYKSPTAARLLVRLDSEMLQRKLDDAGMMALLSLLEPNAETERFCQAVARSPRSDAVRSLSSKFAPQAVAAAPSPPPAAQRQHVVKERENLWKIARLYKVKVDDLIRLNGLEKDQVRPGMVLKVPDPVHRDETGGISKPF